jgi:hypothetical protein
VKYDRRETVEDDVTEDVIEGEFKRSSWSSTRKVVVRNPKLTAGFKGRRRACQMRSDYTLPCHRKCHSIPGKKEKHESFIIERPSECRNEGVVRMHVTSNIGHVAAAQELKPGEDPELCKFIVTQLIYCMYCAFKFKVTRCPREAIASDKVQHGPISALLNTGRSATQPAAELDNDSPISILRHVIYGIRRITFGVLRDPGRRVMCFSCLAPLLYALDGARASSSGRKRLKCVKLLRPPQHPLCKCNRYPQRKCFLSSRSQVEKHHHDEDIQLSSDSGFHISLFHCNNNPFDAGMARDRQRGQHYRKCV